MKMDKELAAIAAQNEYRWVVRQQSVRVYYKTKLIVKLTTDSPEKKKKVLDLVLVAINQHQKQVHAKQERLARAGKEQTLLEKLRGNTL